MHDGKKNCPDCGEGVTRRGFMKTTAGAAAAAALAKAPVWASTWREEKPEALAKRFYESLKPEQKELVALPWEDKRRLQVANNWDIVPQQIGKFYSGDQQQLIRDIFRGIVSEDGAGRFAKQMKDDYGGFERYTVATFGDPSTSKFQWVLTGRHLTMRCNADKEAGAAFGGPMFYGHQSGPKDTEAPDHPGNVFWSQAQAVNKVFAALDGRQQEKALLEKAPADDEKSIKIKKTGPWAGFCVGEMSKDQKGVVEAALKELLAPYRASDVEEAMTIIKDGGLDKVHVAFYQDMDLGGDKVWDRWKIEGPTMSWYFRGSPHVHTWVNVAKA